MIYSRSDLLKMIFNSEKKYNPSMTEPCPKYSNVIRGKIKSLCTENDPLNISLPFFGAKEET